MALYRDEIHAGAAIVSPPIAEIIGNVGFVLWQGTLYVRLLVEGKHGMGSYTGSNP